MLLIWRQYLSWNWARVCRIASFTLLVALQLILFKPMWAITGCVRAEMLLFGQTTSTSGLWWLCSALACWGLFVFRRQSRPAHRREKEIAPMTPNTIRLVVTLALIPLLPGLLMITGMALEDFTALGSKWRMCLAYELCAIVTVILCISLWRVTIEWNLRRRIGTHILLLAVLLVPFSVFLPPGTSVWEAFRDTMPLMMLGVWFIGTALVWRSKPPSLADFTSNDPEKLEDIIRCPQCRYSLIGLREARCPECGWNSTLDDIVGRSLARVMDAED
ncbi:MAG: hypothetical protein ACE5EQ_11700 [Phycisphaerae bacterium]